MTQIVPEVYVTLDGAAWPPATADTAQGTSKVGDWSLDRELVGSLLPGNVRAITGLSVGSAQVAISQTRDGLNPWTQVTVADHLVHLYAVARDGTVYPMGDWRINPAEGALLSAQVDLDLVEGQYIGRTLPNLIPARDNPWAAAAPGMLYSADPVWMVDVLARQAGYYATPAKVASAVLAVPFHGAATDEGGAGYARLLDAGMTPLTYPLTTWSMATGVPGTGEAFRSSYYSPVDPGGAGRNWFYTINLVGTVTIEANEAWAVIVSDVGTIAAQVIGQDLQIGAWTPGDDTTWPNRVTIECLATETAPDEGTFAVRARSSPTSVWGAWVTASSPTYFLDDGFITAFDVVVGDDDSVSGFQVTSTDDPALWAAPTAELELLGGIILDPFMPADLDAWSGIQAVSAAWLAATWVGFDGILRSRRRETIAGIGNPGTALDIDTLAEDLAWSLSLDDLADRLEVTWTHADPEYAKTIAGVVTNPVLWEAPDALEIAAGATVDVVADLEAVGDLLLAHTWVPAWDTDVNVAAFSVWGALPNRDGTGVHPADDALAVTVTAVSIGRVIVHVTNTTAGTLYTVDANGDPCLIIRSRRIARLNNTGLSTRGVAAALSTRTVTVDLSTYVQRAEDAEDLTDFIWARVSTPMWKASSMRVLLDWTRDLADILVLTHPATGLSAKATVTKVTLSGGPGEIAQTLDLVILDA